MSLVRFVVLALVAGLFVSGCALDVSELRNERGSNYSNDGGGGGY